MSLIEPDLQQMPTIAGNAETALAAARALRDFLRDRRTSEHPAQVLSVMVEALIGQLEKGQTPAPLEGSWIVEQLGKRIDGERSASSIMAWKQVTLFFQSRLSDLSQSAATREVGFVIRPVQVSRGKRSATSTYGWNLEPLAGEEAPSPHVQQSDAAYYVRHTDSNPPWFVRPLFPKGVMQFRSWRGIVVFGAIMAALLLGVLLIWGVYMMISYGKLSAAELLSLTLATSIIVLTLWHSLVRPALTLVDDRIAMAPSTLTVFSSEIDGQWELFRDGRQRWIQLVRYTAPCPCCGATLHLSRGEPDWPRRLVGRCAESPREHVYRFDRVTLRGERLR